VTLLGLCYIVGGILGIITFRGPGIENFPWLFIGSLLIMVPIGLLTMACGLGLLLAQRWSKPAWLALSAFLICFHSLWLVSYLRGHAPVLPLLPGIVIMTFCLSSWLFLNSPIGRHLVGPKVI